MEDDTSNWIGQPFLDSEEMDPAVDVSINFATLEGTDFLSLGEQPFASLDDPAFLNSAFDEEDCCMFPKPSNAPAQDDGFAQVQGNSSAQVNDPTSCDAVLDSYGGEDLDSEAYDMAFNEEQDLEPDYNQYSNHKPALNIGQVNMYHANGGFNDMFLQGNRVMNHLSPTSPGQVSLPSPGSAAAEKLKNLNLGSHPYVFDEKVGVNVPYSSSRPVAGTLSSSPAGKKYPPSSLTSPTAGTSHLPYGGQNLSSPTAGTSHLPYGRQNLSSTGMLGSSPNSGHIPTSMTCSTYDSKDNVFLGAENPRQPQQGSSMYMPPPGGLQPRSTDGGGSSGYVQEVDASGDGLRPLQNMAPRSSSLMQRSLSSHSLGQFRALATGPQGNGQMSPVELSRMRDMGGPGARPQQCQALDMQGVNLRPMLSSMRRVHSTGDIQSLQGGSGPDEGGSKINRISPEERKMKIHRYKQKRSERNFNKKIKYACRKTLADSRPRVRGRFAKNDEIELPVKQTDGKHEEDDEEADMVEDDDLLGDEDSSGDYSVVTGLKSIDLKPQEDRLSMFPAG